MAKHGLTRVTFDGDKVIIIAGPVPEHIANAAVEAEPVITPMTKVKHLEKKPNKPANLSVGTQAEPAPPAEKEK